MSVCAATCEVHGLPWPPFETGFSLALWMSLGQQSQKQQADLNSSRRTDRQEVEHEPVASPPSGLSVEECLHLLSVGDSVKAFEVWVHITTASLLCRLTTTMSSGRVVLKEMTVSTGFSPLAWHHIVVSYMDQLDGSTCVGKLSFSFDGYLHQEVILDHPASMWHTRGTSSTTPSLFLGHKTEHREIHRLNSYCMGPVMLFADSGLSREWWFHLYALGPNCRGIGKCDCESARVGYDGLLTRPVIESGLGQDILSGTSPVSDMEKARVALILFFDPENPNSCCTFRPASRKGTGSLLGLVPSGSSLDPLLLQNLSLQPVSLCAVVTVSNHANFPDALEQLGSLQALLFLVAKVVETKEVQETGVLHQLQSKAVHLLLAVIHRFPPLTLTFTQMQGYDLLAVVLKSARSAIGYPLLKVLFDAATSESVFKLDNFSGTLITRSATESIICNVAIISRLLLCWQIWRRGNEKLMELILAALVLLVRKDHPHQSFNIKQMQSGGVVKVLFHIYLDRIQDDLPALSATCGQYVALLVSSIIGHPPELGLLASVTDFLLQIHPATSGFINSTPTALYLNSTWKCGEEQQPTASTAQNRGESPEHRKQPKTSPHAMSASDTGSDMEHMQFFMGHDSSEAYWESIEGSDDSDQTANINRSDNSPHSKSPYPLLEATTGMPTDSFCPNDSSDMSSDSLQKVVARVRKTAEDTDVTEQAKTQEKVSELEDRWLQQDVCYSEGNRKDGCRDTPEKKWITTEMGNGKQVDGQSSSTSAPFTDGQTVYISDTDKGLETLSVSLLQYLHRVVVEYPHEGLDDIFCHAVNPATLLVLAQSPSQLVRVAVTRVLGAYLWRAPGSVLEEFLKMDGFYLLANQLSAFPVGQQQMEAAFSLILSHTFTFQDHYMLSSLAQVSELQQSAPILPLSLLSRTVADIALCHKSLAVFAQLLESTPLMSKVLMDVGLAEVLCNVLYAVHFQCTGTVGVEGVDSVQLLFLDVQNIFCLVAVSHFSWSGGSHYQEVEYLFSILQAMEDQEKFRGEEGVKRVETARALQFAMVVRVLECVQQMSEEFTKTTGRSLSSQSMGALSSVVWHFKPWHPSPALVCTQPLPATPSVSSFSQSSSSVHLRATHSSPEMAFLLDVDEHMRDDGVPEAAVNRSSVHLYHRTSSEDRRQTLLQRLFSRKKKLEYDRIVLSELMERFRKFLVLAVDLAVLQEREEKLKPQTQHTLNFLADPPNTSLNDRFLKHLFTTIYSFLASTLTKETFQKRTRSTFMSSVKDTLRIQFGRVLLCLLSPRMDFDLRIFAISFLMGENSGREVVRLLAGSQNVVGVELGLYIHDLVCAWRDWLNPSQRDLALSLLGLLRQCGCSVTSPETPVHPQHAQVLHEDKKVVDARFSREQQAWIYRRATNVEKVQRRFCETVKRVTDHAMEVTQAVASQQGRERVCLVEHIKQAMAQQVQFKKTWQDIVQSLTHERGAWHQAESYPCSWELDPTEGPGRIRRRLMRCHLGINAKYLLEGRRSSLAKQDKDAPLQYLFEDDHQVADSATLVYKLFTNDTVHNTFGCTAVSPASESRGELLLGEQFLYFVADIAITDTDYTQMLLGNKDQLSMMWRYTQLMEVHSRWYQLQDIALEIFAVTGRTHLLAFAHTMDRDRVLHLLLGQLDRPKGFEQTASDVQKMWVEGTLSNFDYLTCLNKLAGRSFNDLMQYPVFPFVLRDYDSEELNLEDPASFRDLRKPIAVQDKSRERKYVDNYEFLRQEFVKPGPEAVMRVEPFHYGSHYSNSGTVLHYLVRLPPFTRMFLAYQDRSFDIPDRTFHSIHTSWRLSSFDSSTDVKELIPEFFFLPEFLTNNEGFDFGLRQSGERVDDVLLPPWCGGDPRLFVLIHRQALESQFASCMLHHWIDLVFGYKQTGEEAVKAINVFHPSTYFGMDVSSVSDPVKRQALLTMIRTYGQTPRQLFSGPHPSKPHSLPSIPRLSTSGQQEKRTYIPRPVACVNGLQWGSYVGSLDMAQPLCHHVTKLDVPVAFLVPLVTGPVFGIETDSTLITLHSKPSDMYNRPADVLWAGAVTWNHPDGILRVITLSNKPLITFMPPNPYDKVTCCVAALDRGLLFVAGASGNISVYNMTHNVAKPSTMHVLGFRRMLCGHHGTVKVMQVCKVFGIVVSGSEDTTVILWDLNRLSYVRTVVSHRSAVTAVAVSPTLGDIASVSQTGQCSQLCVHTINGSEVGQYSCDTHITCLSYSSAPEGRSINVIAGGLSSGVVRLWSSWDVTHLRDLSYDLSAIRPVLSVAYSVSSQALFVSSWDGSIVMWHHDPVSTCSQAALFTPILRRASDRYL